ncbi:hypothetical protein BDV18DRAFT_138634 [Aspergillus unguis]
MAQPTDYKATGARVDAPTGDGLDRDRAYDSGFKDQISNQNTPEYQSKGAVGADKPSDVPSQTTNQKGADAGERLGNGVRGVFAGVHGAGEWLRGGLNSAVDRTFGSEEGVTRNEAISKAGQDEVQSGRFAQDTQGGWQK